MIYSYKKQRIMHVSARNKNMKGLVGQCEAAGIPLSPVLAFTSRPSLKGILAQGTGREGGHCQFASALP